ncbi:MAG TPA: PRC-barrel domain-containing protein [Gemmatimonadaceae bacterium]|nr:PRC-barrel domain-containing protein [Gemmatimonadaceae bacterium]
MAHQDRDRVTARNDASSGGTLVHTRDLDNFELPKDQPDPRGWDVRSADGSKLGKVEDMLFDTGERRIRYIEVALDKDVAKGSGRDYALVPIGQARLDDNDDNVIVELSSTDLAGAPRYDRTNVSRDYETSLRTWVRERKPDVRETTRTSVSSASTDRDAGFYTSSEYDDARFFSRGRTAGGGGAADRARSTGVADRITDAVDDVKDRIDGNPASRPGPDPTDRRI